MSKKSTILTVLAVLFVLCFPLGLCLGTTAYSPLQVMHALMNDDGVITNVLYLVRLPRLLAGLAAGMGLALSGVILQNVLGNSLASPNIIGVNAGAGFAIVLAGMLFPMKVSLLPAAAVIGALGTALMILMIARKTEASRMTVVLAGIAVSSILAAGTEALITIDPDALTGYAQFRIGGLSSLSMNKVLPAAIVILLASVPVYLMSSTLDVLMLGEETAAALGMNTKRVRLFLLFLAAVLAGVPVSYAGMIGFVGLIVPHIMRRLIGQENRILLPACALAGSVFLVVCDTMARTLFSPYEIPVGILLSLIGGPFFIWLLLKKKGGHHA